MKLQRVTIPEGISILIDRYRVYAGERDDKHNNMPRSPVFYEEVPELTERIQRGANIITICDHTYLIE